jgi:hypothetical protein
MVCGTAKFLSSMAGEQSVGRQGRKIIGGNEPIALPLAMNIYKCIFVLNFQMT